MENINNNRILEVLKQTNMTRKKKIQLIQRELTAINIVIEENNIKIKPIIRIFLTRIEMIINNEEPYMEKIENYLNKLQLSNKNAADIGYRHLTETEKTAFNIH